MVFERQLIQEMNCANETVGATAILFLFNSYLLHVYLNFIRFCQRTLKLFSSHQLSLSFSLPNLKLVDFLIDSSVPSLTLSH